MGHHFHLESGAVVLLLAVTVLSIILAYVYLATPSNNTTHQSVTIKKDDGNSSKSAAVKTPSPRPGAGGIKKRPVKKLSD